MAWLTKLSGGGKLDELSACAEALHGHTASEPIATIEVQLLDPPEVLFDLEGLDRIG